MDSSVKILIFKNNGIGYIKPSDQYFYTINKQLDSVKYHNLEIGKTYIILNHLAEYREAVLMEIIDRTSMTREYIYKYTNTKKGEDDTVTFGIPHYKISGGFNSEASEYNWAIRDTPIFLFFIRDIKAKKNAFELYINSIGHISSSR